MPNKVWKVGLLGAGYIADWHWKALRSLPNVEVVAVCDLSRSRAESFAARYGIGKACTAIAELVQDPRCDAVHVLLPPDLHAVAASELLAAGVHVLLEKPAAITTAECDALIEQSRRVGKTVGVSHNFLFAPIYEQLKADVLAGMLGPISELSVVWNKELGQLRAGPFGGWLFRDPANVMLEIGPHSVAHLLDLVGPPDHLQVQVDRPISLPSGVPFYRRWFIHARKAMTAIDLQYSLGGGFTEHRIHVRGWIGTATCDFEAGTYVLRRHSPLPDDFDRYRITVREGKALIRQARSKLSRYLRSKFKLSRHGNDFGTSIARSLAAFYTGLDSNIDARLSLDFAKQVVGLCTRSGAQATEVRSTRRDAVNTRSLEESSGVYASIDAAIGKTVLVLGGTGFIGQALVRQLVDAGHPVRIMVRDPQNLPIALRGLPLSIVVGDLSRPEDLDKAFLGVSVVCHLARAHVKTWADYVRLEIGGTRNVAEACLRAGVKRFLYTGTIDSCYTGDFGTIAEEGCLDPKIHRRNYYAKAKAESEQMLIAMRDEKGLPLALFRPGIVIGSGGSPFHWGVGMWNGDGVCRIWGKGDHPLPIVWVEDVARALTTAIDAEGVIGKSFNLVGKPIINACEYVVELEKAAGLKIDTRKVSAGKFYRGDLLKWFVKVMVRHPERRLPSYRDWKSRRQRATFDCTNATKILNWQPIEDRAMLVEEGIARPAREWLA